jgi:hypothetical protein
MNKFVFLALAGVAWLSACKKEFPFSCQKNADCPSGAYCKEEVCISGCKKNADCPSGKTCVQGICESAKTYQVLRTTKTAVVDGNNSEFGSAGKIILDNQRGTKGTYQFMWDDQALYVAGRVEDSALHAVYQYRDDRLWLEDSLGLLFDTKLDGGAKMNIDDYQFLVSVRGTQADLQGNGDSLDLIY